MPRARPHRSQIARAITSIRVDLNWERAFAEKWPIEYLEISSQADLNALYVPWYRRPDGAVTTCFDEEAKVLTVRDVAESPEDFSDKAAGIQNKIDEFRDETNLSLVWPAYKLPTGGFLLLDGNHSAVAISRERIPADISLIVIDGPGDEDALPDLRRFMPPLTNA